MSDDEVQSGASQAHELTSELNPQMSKLKKRRALQQGKITRTINRVRKFIDQGAEMRKRVEKEIIEIRKDFELARQCHAEMYEFVHEGQTSALDDWEDVLVKDFYDIEDYVEEFLKLTAVSQPANTMSKTSEQISGQSSNNSSTNCTENSSVELHHEIPDEDHEIQNGQNETGEIIDGSELVVNSDLVDNAISNDQSLNNANSPQSQKQLSASGSSKSETGYNLSSPQSFDSWIDDLAEFKETILPTEVSKMSIAEALYKLEASKDIPNIKLMTYDGEPLRYVEVYRTL